MNIQIGNSRISECENVRFDDLTTQQKERANYLKSRFKTGFSVLVSLLDIRGKNSWLVVDRKLTAIFQAPHDLQHYHNLICENFEIGELYTLPDITTIIAEIRRDLGLPAYLTRLQSCCETDLLNVFLVDDVYKECRTDSEGKKQFIDFVGYMPTFKLKPQD